MSADTPASGDLLLPSQGRAADASASVAELYRDFQPLVARILRHYRRLDGAGILEELPNEIFLAFAQLVRNYDPARGVPFAAYIGSMLPSAVHTIVRRYCRVLARERTGGEYGEEWIDLPDRVGAPLEGPGSDDIALQLALKEALRDALEPLTPRQRFVFEQRAAHEADYVEIAAALGTSAGAVRVMYLEARRRLREHLRATYYDAR